MVRLGRRPSLQVCEDFCSTLPSPTHGPHSCKVASGQRRVNKVFGHFLEYLSGSSLIEDQASLLSAYLSQHVTLSKLLSAGETKEDGDEIVRRLTQRLKEADPGREKQYLLQFVDHLPLQRLQKSLEVAVTKKQHELSRRGRVPFHSMKVSKVVKSPARVERKRKIESLCENNSIPARESGAARHTVHDDDRRVLNQPRGRLAKKAKIAKICSERTFTRNIPDYIVSPKRKTDMCRCCDDLRQVEVGKKMASGATEELQYHQQSAYRQEKAFKKQILEAMESQSTLLVLRLDYKGVTKIGNCSVERDDVYYKLSCVRVCGFVVWMLCPGLEMPVYVDGVSDVLDTTSNIACLLLLRTLDHLSVRTETKQAFAKIQRISVWADCGPHYRSHMFTKCVLWDVLTKYKIQKSSLNFFLERHGKGQCDQHFSTLETYKRQYELHVKQIRTVQEFASALQVVHNAANEVRKDLGSPPVLWHVLVYTAADVRAAPRRWVAKFKAIQMTHSLSRSKGSKPKELRNAVFSDCSSSRRETVALVQDSVDSSCRIARIVVPPADSNIDKLRRKRLAQARLLAGQEAGILESDDEGQDDSFDRPTQCEEDGYANVNISIRNIPPALLAKWEEEERKKTS